MPFVINRLVAERDLRLIDGITLPGNRPLYLESSNVNSDWLYYQNKNYPFLIRAFGGGLFEITTFVLDRSGPSQIMLEARQRLRKGLWGHSTI